MIVKCGRELYLRELVPADYDSIVDIVRACAARSTRNLYHLYKDKSFNNNFKHNMNDIFEKDFLVKLRKNFRHFDDIMSKEKIIYGSQQFTDFLDKIKNAFKFYPDDHLFFPYGPIQPPFNESIKEFLDTAIDASQMENRRIYRMGIVVKNVLIGCFTIDFNEHKILGYPKITTGDPGIFITPHCRDNNNIRSWQEVFSLATTIVERFYPFNDQKNEISATTHRVNEETNNILSSNKGFKEFEGTVLHSSYGARRFFTINYNDFIKNFKLPGTNYKGEIVR